jgi:predicted methyltransferase
MRLKTAILAAAAALAVAACTKKAEAPASDARPAETQAQSASDRLDAVLASMPDEEKARYAARHPKEMLEFFGVTPGMTVVEVLPGGGWWTKILLPYLGDEGRVVGADYPLTMWAKFGDYAPDPEKQKNWPTTWPAEAAAWCEEDCAKAEAFAYGSAPESLKGSVDAVLMFRALHHFSRLDDEGGYYGAALKETFDLLKPGGVVGVEQHRAPAANSDAWADGENGYLKQDAVIARFKAAGFEFVGSSELNANPKDQPTEKDFVWRLPPSYATSGKDPALKAQMEAIGESDRMTLLFRKPAQ